MNILVLGSGGREHALAWKIAQSPKTDKLFIAPGNAGTAQTGENVNIKADDFESIKEFVLGNNIGMVVVGPEDPLVKGIYDYFEQDSRLCHIPVIGPSKAGAQLEGSKDFAKAFMMRHHIPTARYKSFSAETLEDGFAFLETLEAPYVLKADGLAAGKVAEMIGGYQGSWTGIGTELLYYIFAPFLLFTMYIYGTIMGFAFSLFAFYMELLLLKRRKWRYVCGAAVCMGVAVVFKTNSMVMMVAMLLFLVYNIKKRNLVVCVHIAFVDFFFEYGNVFIV